MKTAKRLQLDNFEIIANKAWEMISQLESLPTDSYLFYADDRSQPESDRFKTIPELSNNLKKLGWYDYWINTAIVFAYESGLSIHQDHGTPNYSLLIPIRNTKDTYTVFYDTYGEPEKRQLDNGGTFYWYPPEQAKEIDRIESTSPTLINVKTPHGVLNNSKIQPRVLITLRFHPDFDQQLSFDRY